MLIIGSRALQFHFPTYKKEVNDWDFIGEENEIKFWLKNKKQEDNNIIVDIAEYINVKVHYTIINNIDYEFEVAEQNTSAFDYLKFENNAEGILKYASIETLFSILGSFIHREEVKEKHILDYSFLSNILKKDNLNYITSKRILETDIRFNSLK